MDPNKPPLSTQQFVEQENEIFADALELAPADRSEYVRQRCGSNADLAASVLRLVNEYGRLSGFLQEPVVPPAHQCAFVPGDLLAGQYRIVKMLGAGGMGEVYLAEDLKVGDRLAVKTIRFQVDSEAFRQRFRAEVLLARSITHENICPVHGYYAEGPLAFYTMEYIKGETLAARLKQCGTLPLATVLNYARQIAAGLDAAHRRNVIHRDLKPENILISPQPDGTERLVITDFGLAHTADVISDGQSTQIVGSPDYMAPEQFNGGPATRATDVFGFGLLLFEMISGHRPYPKQPLFKAALRRLTRPADPLDAPSPWPAVVARALRIEPSDRWPSAVSLLEALEQQPEPEIRSNIFRVRRPTRRELIFSSGSVAAMSAFFFAYRYSKQPPAIPQRPTIYITDMTQSLNTPNAATLAQSLDLLMAQQINQSSELAVLGAGRVAAVRKLIAGDSGAPLDPVTIRQIALREGAPLVLFASIGKIADEYILRYRLELMGDSPAQARHHWPKEFTAASEHDLSATTYEASNWIRRIAGESAESLSRHNHQPEQLTTRSWEALQEYTRAQQAWTRQESSIAETYLRSALSIDPEFAAAEARLADILSAVGRPDESMEHWGRAAGLLSKQGLSTREALLIRAQFAMDTGQHTPASQVLDRYIAEYPRDEAALVYKSTVLSRLNQVEPAIRLLQQVSTEGTAALAALSSLAALYLETGDLTGAQRTLKRLEAKYATDWFDQLTAALHFAHGDGAQCRAVLDHLQRHGTPAFQSKAYALKACYLAEQGSLAAAESALKDGIAFDRAQARTNVELFTKIRLLAQLKIAQKQLVQARMLCYSVVNQNIAGAQSVLEFGCVLAQAGDIHGAMQCLAKLRVPAWPIYEYWKARLRSELALAHGHARQAITLMLVAPTPPTRHLWADVVVRACSVLREGQAAALPILAPMLESCGRYLYEAEQNMPGCVRAALPVFEHLDWSDAERGKLSRLSALFPS